MNPPDRLAILQVSHADGTDLKLSDGVARITGMEKRDLVVMLAALLLSIALTWAGTDYVVDHVVLPLTQDEPAGSPDRTP